MSSRETSPSPPPSSVAGVGLPLINVPVGLSKSAHECFKFFTGLLNVPRRAADPRERKQFERLLLSCDQEDIAVLIEKEALWKLLRDGLVHADTCWDVMGLLLNRMSLETEGRAAAVENGYVALLGDTLSVRGKLARGDKAIERLGGMACIVSLLAVDAEEARVAPWVLRLCIAVRDALERSQIKGNNAMEAYSLLSIFIKLLYTATGSPLATVSANSYLNLTHGSVALLLRVARRGLVDEQLSGVPKIIAEKALVVLSKLNADAPPPDSAELRSAGIFWGNLNPMDLGNLLLRIVRESSWVQSQDIALTFFGRLIFSQHQIPLSFLDEPVVALALQHVLSCKSMALKLTAVAFLSLAPTQLFYSLLGEFEAALDVLAGCTGRTLKLLMWEAGRGIWGFPPACPLSQPAACSLETSEFLKHAAEISPAELPRCLWRLLPEEVQRKVATSQGVDDPFEGEEADEGEEEEQEEEGEQGPNAGQASGLEGDVARGWKSSVDRGSHYGIGLPPKDEGTHGPWTTHEPAPATTTTSGSLNGSASRSTLPPLGPPMRRPSSTTIGAPPVAAAAPSYASALDSLLSAGVAVGLAAFSTGEPGPDGQAAAAAVAPTDETLQTLLHLQKELQETPGAPIYPVVPSQNLNPRHHQPLEDFPVGSKRSREEEGGGGGHLFHVPPAPAESAGVGRRGGEDGDDDEDYDPSEDRRLKRYKQQRQQQAGGSFGANQGDNAAAARTSGRPPLAPASAYPNLTGGVMFGTEDIKELNQLLDLMFLERNSLGPSGPTLIKNMAEGAANMSVVVYLATYRLPRAAIFGLDERLTALKTRAYLVYNGVLNSEPMDLLLPMSELLSAESGIMRRGLEAQARAVGVPATEGGIISPYDGGEGIRYNVW